MLTPLKLKTAHVRVLSALSVALLGTTAHATILAGGNLYGGTNQTQVTCYLFNAGQSAVTVSVGQIIQENIGPVTLFANNCTSGLLAARSICHIAAHPTSSGTYSCLFQVDPDGAEVRGVLDIRSGNGGSTVLQTTPLR